MIKYSIILYISFFFILCGNSALAEDIKVMSYNILYSTSPPRQNVVLSWNERRELLFNKIDRKDPDIIGLQEVRKYGSGEENQLNNLIDRYDDEYNFIYFPMNPRSFLHLVIMYKKRFSVQDSGFIELPATDGAIFTDRRFVWVDLKYGNHENAVFTFINTHLDHKGADDTRIVSAQRIVGFVEDNKWPTILVGDLNDHPNSETINILSSSFNDLLCNATSDTSLCEAPTFCSKNSLNYSKIDYILGTNEFVGKSVFITGNLIESIKSNIIDTNLILPADDERSLFISKIDNSPLTFPSDHFAVGASIEIVALRAGREYWQ